MQQTEQTEKEGTQQISIHTTMSDEERSVISDKLKEAFDELGYNVKYAIKNESDPEEELKYKWYSSTVRLDPRGE